MLLGQDPASSSQAQTWQVCERYRRNRIKDYNNYQLKTLTMKSFIISEDAFRSRYRIIALKHRPGRSVNVTLMSALFRIQFNSKRHHLTN